MGSDKSAGRRAEPVAVIGMACRFPGAPDIPSFWRLLDSGTDAVSEGIPGSGVGRVGQLFPDGGVQSEACRFGAYLDELDRFDAAFFRISPAEAERLDPQQRLMLEVSWQALEDAGIAPERLEGSRTGVYAGISNNEYRGLILDADQTAEPAASLYSVTGTSFNTAIGRVAFALGLQGPALALDTACSSSLVAAHQAIADLQRSDADLALAGGVHTILSGRLLELRGNAGMLSPDGRCKTFDASANGYVRGEGCGIVVLKRFRDAVADGDRIWGVIRGSAVNQDGASAGLTVPNPEAQASVIGEALARAGVRPIDVDYLEAHGTGTEVGDPIEIEAAGAAYGGGRPADRPLLIGSVKTNFGHLESAAGVAGLIKVVLAMQHGVIPQHLHFRTPNPRMDWERLPLRVTATKTDWPAHPDRPPRAGISGFGWSGTNAHLVVEGYSPTDVTAGPAGPGWPSGAARRIAVQMPESVPDPSPAGPALPPRSRRLLPLSGKSEDSLREIAEGFLAWLDDQAGGRDTGGDGPLADLAWTAGVGRSHFSRRAGVVFRDAASLRQRLAELAEAGGGTGLEVPGQTVPRVAFLYTGQASQWVGMGEDLYRTEPVFRTVLDHCERLFEERRGSSLLDALFGRGDEPPELDDPVWKQPAIYALECALTALWASLGVRPDVVLGHSLGELAAAQAAGVYTLADGLRFAAVRGELIGAVPGAGRMGAIFAPRPEVAAAVEEQNAGIPEIGLSVAADNGAHQVVSGPADQVEAILERFDSRDIRVRRLRKSPAYHSAMLDPALDELEAVLSEIPVAPPSVPFVSNLDGRVRAPDRPLDGEYWRRQTREMVEFRRAVETLAEMGVGTVVEIGPHAVLGPMVSLAWPESTGADGTPVVVSSLRRPSRETPEDAEGSFVQAVATAYEAGLPIFFPGLFAGEFRRRVSLPGYPFQRERHWIKPAKRRRLRDSHPLLGNRHESASGELGFETEVTETDPPWLGDHRVFDRLVAPGALYGAMAISASSSGMPATPEIEDLQLHNPLILAEEDDSRRVQVILDQAGEGTSRRVRVLSRRDDGEWTLHAEGAATPGQPVSGAATDCDPEDLKARLAPADISAFYRAKAAIGIGLGPPFRTLRRLWSGTNEALAEITLPAAVDPAGIEVHPLLLDGCFQAMAAARSTQPGEGGVTYLPFAWERFWRTGSWPERVLCHVRLRRSDGDRSRGEPGDPPEVLSADLEIYDASGAPLGGLDGYTIKRATRATLLAAVEGLDDLLYEVVWRDGTRPPAMPAADFLPDPQVVRAGSKTFVQYLADEDVGADTRAALLDDLERLARSYAVRTLNQLGWERRTGAVVDPEDLRQRLRVTPNHTRLFRRMLEMLARSGLVEECGHGFRVTQESADPLPRGLPADPEEFATHMAGAYAHGTTEIGLFRRSAGALPEVLRGRADPLTLLFSSGEPTAADLYLKAPVARAANRMLGEAIRALLAGLPDGRDLRVLEVGAGTGSATASVLSELPEGRFRYVYTDISAGFFAEAEARFGDGNGAIEYRVLDIEKDPVAQGFDAHGYDLLIASNVLHATRYLDETLAHCGALLAPSGQLVALENLREQGWLDLTFGQLDGWWRFADRYRPQHALSGPPIWRRALGDAGFGAVEFLGVDDSEGARPPDRGIIMAAGPAEVTLPAGIWVVAADRHGAAAELATELAGRNQTVVLAEPAAASDAGGSGITRGCVDFQERESWSSLLATLPEDLPLNGIVHLVALDGPDADAPAEAMATAVQHITGSALALAQALAEADRSPAKGLWFVTRGAQVLEKERGGQVAGATLWGLGKVVAREASHLEPRLLDLDPERPIPVPDLAEELLFPDPETQVAYREGRRRVARLVRAGAGDERLSLPERPDWLLTPDPGGALEKLHPEPMPRRSLEARDVRVAVDATGLNFWDVFRSIGFIPDGLLGGEMCGRVLEVGEEVSAVSPGDRIVGLAFGTFGPEVVTHEEMLAPAPPDVSASELATLPTAFVSALLSYDLAELKAGERVLIHAGAGGVGLAAIQLAQAAGAEVFTTASVPKQDFLRSLGVEHVFDSRRTDFGRQILGATGGAGVQVVVNSLTGEGFIEASLSCLAEGGRFVELSRRGILTDEDMAAVRPDVAYSILELDDLKENHPAIPGNALRRVMRRFAAGEITPLIHSRWPLAEARAAMRFMQAARHLGKIVFTAPALTGGRLRSDRTYLVTGGLGGIGCALAGWMADKGAGAIVLNGRRDPDAAAERMIGQLERRGVRVRVEIADVTDPAAVDTMLTRIDADLPPLAGVIHSVGVLSDRALGNQTWADFERVLWPKVLGSWHLHRATADRDLEMFVLFSSVAGTLGNPGQANHAAANAFLDQLAAHRRALGLPGHAIAWGAWSGLGEAEEQRERITRQLAATGTGWFNPQQGLRAFERLLHEDVAASVVLAADWAAFGEAVENPPPAFQELLTKDADAGDAPGLGDEPLLARLRQIPAESREETLISFLRQEVQAVLRLPKPPAPKVGFFDLGMDSLMAVELRNRLNREFAGEYSAPNTVVFDHPDIAALAAFLTKELAGVGSTASSRARHQPSAPAATSRDEDRIAIIGMACRFPGAPDLATFWAELEAGRDAVTGRRPGSGSGVPGDESKGDARRSGGFIEGVDQFDARFFRITPIDARTMDPQQRLLLETSWHALEDAGIDPEQLRGSRTGVYAGVAASEYRDLMVQSRDGVSYLGTARSMAVGRLAFKLGLMGPTLPVELNCASSLVAVHQAAAGLRQREADLALVGGVNVILSRSVTTEMAALGMLSPTGRCRTFDAAADGFVRGEGCGVVVLKRLAEAEADGDRIWAVICGSAVNQNGASAGPTVPNGSAQEQVIEAALERAGFSGAELDYLEAHGNGSGLGDPIEARAAAAVYGQGRAADRPLLIGSVKTNIGHLETAAGVAGLIKAVLAMNRRVIPKHLHFENPTPHIDWDRLPVRVAAEATDWPAVSDRSPRAAVSAFGVSGTNAHVVVEGYGLPDGATKGSLPAGWPAGPRREVPVAIADSAPIPSAESRDRVTRLLPLSGKTPTALRELAGRYLRWLDAEGGNGSTASAATLADMAWTAGVGRAHFRCRAGLVFRDAATLRQGLDSVCAGDGPGALPEAEEAPKLAFAYGGEEDADLVVGRDLYETEPVVRAILDRCEAVMREQTGLSLLEAMFPRGPWAANQDGRASEESVRYALQCAMTALWASVGVRPAVVVGKGDGNLAAAQAAGALQLEAGLRCAAALGRARRETTGEPDRGSVESVLGTAETAPPSLPWLRFPGGQLVTRGELPGEASPEAKGGDPSGFDDVARVLSELEASVVVNVGPGAAFGLPLLDQQVEPTSQDADDETRPNLASLDTGTASAEDFVTAVAKAHTAGLDVSFAGLFAGEERRLVSLPAYPFQRRRYWLREREPEG